MGIRPPDSTPVSSHKRDRLTGYALDDGGGYRVPVVVEGKAFAPRFYQCATPECLNSGANIDFSDVNTLLWLQAADAKAVSDVGVLMTAGAILASGGVAGSLSYSSTAATLLSGFMKEDFGGAVTQVGWSMGFEAYAKSRGLSADAALKLTNSLSLAKVWENIASNALEVE